MFSQLTCGDVTLNYYRLPFKTSKMTQYKTSEKYCGYWFGKIYRVNMHTQSAKQSFLLATDTAAAWLCTHIVYWCYSFNMRRQSGLKITAILSREQRIREENWCYPLEQGKSAGTMTNISSKWEIVHVGIDDTDTSSWHRYLQKWILHQEEHRRWTQKMHRTRRIKSCSD